MDINEMMRLAGAEDGAESFQVALDGKAPAGSQLPSARVRQALGEARGGMLKQASDGSSRLYGRIQVAVDALGEVYEVLCDLWKALDRLRYGEDPESGIGEAAGKLLDGPMTDVEKLVKGVGYALDSRFDARREYERGSTDSYVSRSYRDVDALGVHLHGEVAEALAVLERVAPLLDKAKASDVYNVDLDLWKTAGPAFVKNVRGRVDVVTTALDQLMVRKVTQDLAGTDALAFEQREAAVDTLGKALGESLRHGREESPEWGFGLGESAGAPVHLAVPGHGTVALVPTNADAYEVRSVRAGKVGAHSYGVIRAGKLAKITAGYESLMEATLKAAVQEALDAQGTATAMHAMAEDARSYVGKAFVQYYGNDSLWVLGTRAVKSDQVLVSLVRAFEDKNTAESATAAHLKLADLQAYEEHPLRDVPAPVLARWRASGALAATQRSLAEARAVFVAKITIPATKPSSADESPDRWAAEEKKMAADFELAMERSPIKSAKAPKARVKVTQVGFKKVGATYALQASLEVSGDGVSSLDDELIDAIDTRAQSAVDAVIDNGEQAADVAFRNVDWKHVTLDVL